MAFLATAAIRIALLIVLLSASCSTPRAASTNEYALMALYIYNFAKFTHWPAESFDSEDAALELCVLGDDPFESALDDIAGKTVKTRTLTIKRYPRVAIVSGCHILFISRSEQHRLGLILRDIRQLPILTVSDIESFSLLGGMIALFVQEQRVRFAVNPGAAVGAGISVSSKLLELAVLVNGRQ